MTNQDIENTQDTQIIQDVQEAYIHKMKNKMYGLLRERERGRDWENFLNSIIIEVSEFSEKQKTINYLSLVNKLNSLRYLRYEYFRTTVFACMDLFDKIDIHELS